jgi:hypothetical protein
VENKEDQLKIVILRSKIVDLIKDVEALAKEAGIDIVIDTNDQDINIANANKAKKPAAASDKETEKTLLESLPSENRIMVSIRLSGAYGSIVRFMQKLESMPYETDVVAVDVSVLQSTTTNSQSRVNMFASSEIAAPAADTANATVVPTPAPPQKELRVQAIVDTAVYVKED